jgi:hypothetical protein
MRATLGALLLCLIAFAPECAEGQYQRPPRPAPPHRSDTFTSDQVKRQGYDYFGTASRGLVPVAN